MSKNSWLGLIMPDPDKAWKEAGRKPKDNTVKVKAKVLAGIQNCITQLEAIGPEGDAPARAWFSFKGDLARVSIKRGNKMIPVAGRERNVVPRERAIDFYKGALTAVENGDLDVTGATQAAPAPARRGRRPATK